jgi:hypothetical protein
MRSGTCQEFCVFPRRASRRSFAVEPRLEHGVELVECGLHVGSNSAPFSVLKGSDGDPEFDFGAFLGLEVVAAVSAEDLELAVDGLDGVGGGEGPTDAIGVVEKGEVVRSFLPYLIDVGLSTFRCATLISRTTTSASAKRGTIMPALSEASWTGFFRRRRHASRPLLITTLRDSKNARPENQSRIFFS